MSKTFTKDDVASHSKEADGLWIIVDEDVYDVTKFQDEHPGKYQVLVPRCPCGASHSPFPFPEGVARDSHVLTMGVPTGGKKSTSFCARSATSRETLY